MLDSIGKNLSTALTIRTCILLGTNDNSFGAMHAVDAVDYLI